MRLGLELSKLGIASAVLAAAPQVAQAAPTAITGVQLNSSNGGVTVQLQAANGAQLETLKTRYGQTLAIDVINTQLQFAQGEGFSRQNPASGIVSVEVVQQYPNTVRVVLEGTDAIPEAEVSSGPQGLSVAASTQQVTAQAPDEQAAPEAEGEPAQQQGTAAEQQPQETIELIVTPTRTEEREQDVPRSVTVVDREEIERQSNLSRNVGDILGKTVPGFAAPTQAASTLGQTLRGRDFEVLIDGVPQSNNRDSFKDFATIDPSAIERIEVLRGPTAIYGGNAAGGVINIITRSPGDHPFSATTSLEFNGSTTNFDDSLGFTLEQTLTGNAGDLDYVFTGSFDSVGAFFDAKSDRIPGRLTSSDSLGNSRSTNLFGKLGADITNEQRVQFSVNLFNQRQDTDFVARSADNTPGKIAFAKEVEELDIEDKPGRDNVVLNLSYSHEDFLSGNLDAQVFYRDFENKVGVFDFNDPPKQTIAKNEQWGFRLDAETPLADNDKLNLVWGADYVNETNFQPRNVLEEVENNKFRNTGEQTVLAPRYNLESFGAFAQLDWEITDRLNLRGGVRHERIGVSFDSFETDFTRADNLGTQPGQDVSINDTVFNIGTTYDISDGLNFYAAFSQGFQIPDVGRGIREGVDELDLEPQVVDNYEVGLRGNWDSVQASISSFYTFSELGVRFSSRELESGRTIKTIKRDPKNTWGVEAKVDWQPAERWKLGGSFTWTQGRSDNNNNNGNFTKLPTSQIPPVKVTAYLENQTTPSWSNRFQVLSVGNRNVEADAAPVNSYVVLDYISNIQIGSGELTIGIENLSNNQYVTAPTQANAFPGFPQFRPAARGRRFSINYSINW
ncbi:MAG: TonB-dependent siderophore receptor [Cyanobacteria bacterium QS_8_64_29]|nr:MAG: TonB-dependent siderophore receptor [Cyanobacteria bacterium QS_8_64_29]